MTGGSPFLETPASSWLATNRSAFAIEDRYPVNPGHSLVVPRRLISSWWQLGTDERADIWDLVDVVKALLDSRHAPDGYNVGFNAGAAAGQTVEHLHVHVIPRFGGDVPDPRGGIRWVVPERANYLVPPSVTRGLPMQLVDSVDKRILKLELFRCLINESFDRVDLLVSFIMRSGVSLVERHLRDALNRGTNVRVLTTDYLTVTHPDALVRLIDLGRRADVDDRRGRLELRAFQDPLTSFHPKAYLFWSSTTGVGRGFVGSNNLSRSGIADGIEWSVQTVEIGGLLAAFDRLWEDPRCTTVDEDWLTGYGARFRDHVRALADAPEERLGAIPIVAETGNELDWDRPTPRPIQVEALAALEATRVDGFRSGLVVMATGLGKTWLAAFDSQRSEFPRVLFVAHREEILTQARDVFRSVRPDARLGFFTSAEKSTDADVVFATVQTLHRHLGSFSAGAFDYVVVDEFHHASARTYRRVLNHFEPRFLLGLTATPERLDGADLLALCGDNLVYRCDLIDGVERSELAPFHYWGVADTVDFTPIPWRNGRFDPAALEAAVATSERAGAAHREWAARAGQRTLAFCGSIRHAEYMATYFNGVGVRAVALHSQSEPGLRTRAVDQLERGDLAVLFTVELFNEGVDLPTLDTVLMLRPTESPVVFLQQLGRGLRIAAGKDHLDVVDFVGNHRAFLAPLRTLMSLHLGRVPTNRELLDAVRDRTLALPPGCSVEYSLEAVELLEALLRERRTGATDVLRDLCLQLAEEDGVRPSALQVTLAGGNVRAAKRRAGGWFELLDELDLLSPEEQHVVASMGAFLTAVAATAMTRSFKMVVLRALLHDGRLRSGMPLNDLAARSLQIVQGDPRLATDVDAGEFPTVQVVETAKWERYWQRNPIDAWSGGDWFAVDSDRFVPQFDVGPDLADAFDAMVAELVEWRLHDYFVRGARETAGADEAVLRVSHAGGTPIIRLDRKRFPWLPEGTAAFIADGERHTGRFVKVALNVATKEGTEGNALAALLRRWFGPSAGHPGSDHRVVLAEDPDGWALRPAPTAHASVGGESVVALPHFPTYAVACGAFDAPVPADVAPRHQTVAGLADLDPDEFLVTVRGDSMSGGDQPLSHGDLVRMRWTRRRSVESLVGHPVLVELGREGERHPALKLLGRDDGGYVLQSAADGYEDIPASRAMTVVGELVGRVDPAAWDPIGGQLGHDFRRDDVPALFGLDYNPGNWQSGHVSLADDTVLFVTLDKESGRSGEEYVDRFESIDTFHWTSQASTSPASKKGREVIDALDEGRRIHLFVRRRRQEVAFTYCGLVAPLRHESSQPMTVWFRVLTPLSPDLERRFHRER